MKLLFIHPYPQGKIPSQRFRFEQYLDMLKDKGFDIDIAPFFDLSTIKVMYLKGRILVKLIGLISGFIRRAFLLFRLGKYDFVFIHREAMPVGPPIIEWIIAKIFNKKIIYDFDDAIWLPNVSESNQIFSAIKYYSKVQNICSWSHKVSCGNQYLSDFASQYSKQVVLNPTTIDIKGHHNRIKDHSNEKMIIGWTGTHTTMHHLKIIVPVLEELEKTHSFEFYVISNEEPTFKLRSLHFVLWSKENEIDDLLQFNIGVMPMYDNSWTKGKCGFKLLQYMALGIPALASPVGANSDIIDIGINGFLCDSPEAWKEHLIELLGDQALREHLGRSGIEKVNNNYSLESNGNNFLSLFQ